MPIRFYTGFEADTTILAADGIVLSGGATTTTAQRNRTLSGRGGDTSLSSSNTSQTCVIPVFGATAGEEIAMACRFAPGGLINIFFRQAGTVQCSLEIAADGFMRLYRGQVGTLLATSAATLAGNTWHWLLIEVTARELASNGRMRVYVGGSASVFVDTGIADLRNTAVDDFDSVFLRGNTSFFDDYVQASAGALPDQVLYVQLTRPVADSTPVESTPSTGASRFGTIDETPVSLIDYNEITVSGHEDRLTFSPLGFTPTSVLAVRPMAHMTGEGTINDGRTLVRFGATDQYGVNRPLAVGGTYAIVADIFETKDGVSAPITGADVDAIVAGYEGN